MTLVIIIVLINMDQKEDSAFSWIPTFLFNNKSEDEKKRILDYYMVGQIDKAQEGIKQVLQELDKSKEWPSLTEVAPGVWQYKSKSVNIMMGQGAKKEFDKAMMELTLTNGK